MWTDLAGVTGTRKRHCEVFSLLPLAICGEPLHMPAWQFWCAPRGYEEVMTPQQGCDYQAYRAENHLTKNVHSPSETLGLIGRNVSRFRAAKIGVD
jgi:hypothetical protein